MAIHPDSLEELLRRLGPDDLVLDVGAWWHPFTRADWVIDILPYETRGRGGTQGPPPERFSADTWVVRDICDHEPWPFTDNQFDFAVCAHTLEDVRDPVWVCRELTRVAKAGYVEVPSRLVEQTYGFQGPWVGWGHHHWLVDISDGRIEFVFKHHIIHGPEANHFPSSFYSSLTDDEQVQRLWWKDSFEFGERLIMSAEELDPYLADFVAANRDKRERQDRISRLLRRVADRVR